MEKVYELKQGKFDLGKAYTATLIEMMRQDERVVHLDADMRGTIGTQEAADIFPDRVIEVGIAEANMIGIACGLSVGGKVAFANSFGIFTTRRCADQIYMSGCYNNANVKILGTDPGVSATHNGGTHMPLDDMSIMRSFAGMSVYDVADTALLKFIVKKMKDQYGMCYIRFPRKTDLAYYPENYDNFELGKGVLLRDGSDISIIASGMEVPEALKAADMLAEKGISAQVVDMYSIKPLDKELVISCAKKTGAVVTAENHTVIGGLGSAVAEVLGENLPTKMRRVGVKDRFGEVGTVEYLMDTFGIAARNIFDACMDIL